MGHPQTVERVLYKAMELHLEHFCCWKKLDLKFNAHEITLITGKSGSGKTSIMRAILWVLFGREMRVVPISNPKAVTLVRLTLEDLIVVERRKNTADLRAKRIGEEQWLHQEDAQQLINHVMTGSSDNDDAYTQWMACTYLGRACRNTFMQASTRDKLKILSHLAYLNDNPSEIQQAIREHEKKTRESLLKNRAVKEYEEQLEKDEKSPKPIKRETALRAKAKLTELTARRVKVESEQAEYDRLHGKVEGLRDNAKQLIKEMEDHEVRRPEVPSTLDQYQGKDFMNHLNEIEVCLHTLSSQTPLEGYGPHLDEEVLDRYIIAHRQYIKEKNLCDKLKVKYDREEVDKRISGLEMKMLQHQVYSMKEKLQNLVPVNYVETVVKDKVDHESILSGLREELSENKINAAKVENQFSDVCAEIKRLNDGVQGDVKCPSCDTPLHIVRQGRDICVKKIEEDREERLLTLGTERDALSKILRQTRERVDLLNGKISSHVSDMRRQQEEEVRLIKKNASLNESIRLRNAEIAKKKAEVESYLTEHSSVEGCKLENESRVASAISCLRSLKLASQPDIERERLRRDVADAKWKLHQWMWQEDLHNLSDARLCLQYEERSREHDRRTAYMREELTRIEDSIAEITLPCKPDITLIEIDNVCRRAEQAIRAYKIYKQHLDKKKNRDKIREDVVQCEVKYERASELTDMAKVTEVELLHEIRDSLNHHVNESMQVLFSDSTTLQLTLTQQSKSNKNIRYKPELNVSSQGINTLPLATLSGGESDRASMAFTLALAYISQSPILLLDESLGSLDSELKERMIRVIKKSSPKFTLVVMLDGVQGIYDRVIDLESGLDNAQYIDKAIHELAQ